MLSILRSSWLAANLRHSAAAAINCYFLNILLDFAWQLGNAFRPFYYFAVYFDCFEAVADSGLMDIPQRLLDPLALLGDQLFVLMREKLNALPNPRVTLKPTGIAVSIIIIARFPASLPVSGYARLRRCPQSAILLIFRVLQRLRPRRRYCEEVQATLRFWPFRLLRRLRHCASARRVICAR